MVVRYDLINWDGEIVAKNTRFYGIGVALFKTLVTCLLVSVSLGARASALDAYLCKVPKPMPGQGDLGYVDLSSAILFDFSSGDFKSIIRARDLWEQEKCRLPDGDLMSEHLLAGATAYFKSEKNWSRSLEQIEKFEAEYPDDILPFLYEARYWFDYGYEARGIGYASTVSPEGWRLLRERLSKSHSVLMKIQASGKSAPLWYAQMIRDQKMLGVNDKDIKKTFLEGVKRYPESFVIYSEMSYYLEPRWGGSWKKVDELIDFATQRIQSESADVVYATLYAERALFSNDIQNFFSNSMASWPRVKKGFGALLEKYPSSTRLSSQLGKLACIANDRDAYLEYRTKFPVIDYGVWIGGGPTHLTCDQKFGLANDN